MKSLYRGLAFAALVLALLALACGSDDRHPATNNVFNEQAACRISLANAPDTAEHFDGFVDVSGPGLYAVTVEDGTGGWKAVPGPLDTALLDVYAQARKAGKPVRLVYGPGLSDAIRDAGGSIKAMDTLEAKQTYYATLAVGCTEVTPGSHHPAEGDCIPEAARECRVTLVDGCDSSTAPFLDIAFASWDTPADDAGATKACYGVNASGAYAISLPAKDFCQCGVNADAVRALNDNARQLLDAALELRGLDGPTATAISSGMASAALAGLDAPK